MEVEDDGTLSSRIGEEVQEAEASAVTVGESSMKRSVEESPDPPRNKKMQFVKTCPSVCHDKSICLFPRSNSDGFFMNNRKVICGKLRDWTKSKISEDILEKTWICASCVEFGKAIVDGETEANLMAAHEKRCAEFIVERLFQGSADVENARKIGEALGSYCRQEVQDLGNQPRPIIHDLHQAYNHAWKNNDLKVLKCFLEAASGTTSLQAEKSDRQHRHLQKAAENLCLVSNNKFISATAAAESVVLHAFTGSRTAVDLYTASNASGGHTFISNLIQSMSLSTPVFPKGDIFVAFDNQQVIGREYRVSSGGGQRTSVVTTISVFKERLPVNVQSNFDMPTHLPIPSSDPAAVWRMFLNFEDSCTKAHRFYREDWISKRLLVAKSEHQLQISDLESPELCGFVRSRDYESGLEYGRVPSGSSSCSVTDMESLPVNPNSNFTVRQVLDTLLDMNNTSDPNRKWFSVYCDGLPFGIAWKLIQTTYACKECQVSGTESQLKNHGCSGNSWTRKYEKILLRPGAGHMELNLVRTVFREYFEIYIRPVAQALGFNSPKSLDYCKAALDHHKSWQILQIIFVALGDELIHRFVIENPSTDFSLRDFSKWKDQQKNPNILLALDFVFTTLHSIFLFRSAIRQCNDQIAYAALFRASGLFFGFNHPKYRDIIFNDFFMGICSPSEGSPVSRKLAFKLSGSEYGQGLEFLLEERNRMQKNWIFATGVPTLDQWRRASASLSFFESIKQAVQKNLEWTVCGHGRHRKQFGNEYLAARAHFREVLSTVGENLQTLTKFPFDLNPKFANCSFNCAENMKLYFKSLIQGKVCYLNVISSENLHEKSLAELTKQAKRRLRGLPGFLKSDFESRISNAAGIDEVIEIIGEIDFVIEGCDCPFEYQE